MGQASFVMYFPPCGFSAQKMRFVMHTVADPSDEGGSQFWAEYFSQRPARASTLFLLSGVKQNACSASTVLADPGGMKRVGFKVIKCDVVCGDESEVKGTKVILWCEFLSGDS